MTQAFRDNSAASRYELVEDGMTAWADYRRDAGRLYIDHVESPVALRGAGTAGRLMQAMMDDVRAQGLKVTPICGYAATWLRRHKDMHDMVA